MAAGQLAKFLEGPLVGLFVVLLLGALAVSGRVSQFAANLVLLAALAVALVAMVGSSLPDFRLKAALACGVIGVCLITSYWISPSWRLARVSRPWR